MALGHSPKIVTNGLVMYLDAGNPRSYPGSGTSWTDLSQSNNSGTLTSTTYSSNSIVFNGSTSYVEIPNSTTLDPRRTFSIDVWFYVSVLSATWTSIFNKTNTTHASLTRTYAIYLNSTGFVLFNTTDGTTNNQFSTNAGSIVTGTWYNYCVCIDRTAGTGVSYLNNVVVNNVAVAQTDTLSTTNSIYIGGRYAYNFFNGSIPSVKFYNRALSSQEVGQNFNAVRGRFGI